MRPARAAPWPPERPIVRSTRRRPRRASQSASSASTAATGTAKPAWTSRRSLRYSATPTAAGIVASASKPSTMDAPAARFRGFCPLLLDVRSAIGGRWDRAADEAGDRDQGEHVRNRGDQVGRDVGLPLERAGQSEPEAEEDRRCKRQAWPPFPEDDGCQCDEAAAVRHVLLERAREPDREKRSPKSGQ